MQGHTLSHEHCLECVLFIFVHLDCNWKFENRPISCLITSFIINQCCTILEFFIINLDIGFHTGSPHIPPEIIVMNFQEQPLDYHYFNVSNNCHITPASRFLSFPFFTISIIKLIINNITTIRCSIITVFIGTIDKCNIPNSGLLLLTFPPHWFGENHNWYSHGHYDD